MNVLSISIAYIRRYNRPSTCSALSPFARGLEPCAACGWPSRKSLETVLSSEMEKPPVLTGVQAYEDRLNLLRQIARHREVIYHIIALWHRGSASSGAE